MAHRTLEIAEEEIDKISKLDEHFNELEVNLHKVKFEATKKTNTRCYCSFLARCITILLYFRNSHIHLDFICNTICSR